MINLALCIFSFVFGSYAFACSELGKQEFKLDTRVGLACATIAQEVALRIGNATFPPLRKGESVAVAPHSPFNALGLEPHAKLSTAPSETLEKKKGFERSATFSVAISTRQGMWECLYCVTFEIQNDNCVFKKAAIHHCAGGVSYGK